MCVGNVSLFHIPLQHLSNGKFSCIITYDMNIFYETLTLLSGLFSVQVTGGAGLLQQFPVPLPEIVISARCCDVRHAEAVAV